MLRLALVFHANQALSPFAALASPVCYRGLWAVLRAHPRVRCALHLSGTLLHALGWLDPGALDPVRAGLADGQFELLGSTYAQNVPYATGDRDNRRQIALHRELLARTFGVRPAGFWNAERCWRQSLVPLIAEGGYRYTLLEEPALRAAGASDGHATYTTRAGSARLDLVPDNEAVKHRWNWAVWSGEHGPLLDYLARVRAARPDGIVGYAEDAEAVGLWGYERGLLPQADWARLDALLTRLEQEPELAFAPPGELPPGEVELTPIPDHQAVWMTQALRNPAAPYHEPGYADWFDFNARAPKLRHFRAFYATVGAALDAIEPAEPGGPGAGLARHAAVALAANQYEFGCVGVGGIGQRLWEQARSALIVARAAELAAAPRAGAWSEDANQDGAEELLLCDGRQLAVLSALGGRLLHWLDLERGAGLAGNECALPFSAYSLESGYPVPRPRRARWLPAGTGRDLDAFAALRELQTAPGPWSVFLPEEVWRASGEIALYRRPPDPGDTFVPPPLRHGALNDTAFAGRRRALHPGGERPWSFALAGDSARFALELPGVLRVAKEIRLEGDGLAVRYELQSLAERPARLSWTVESELSPDYLAALDGGRAALRFWTQSSARRHGRWRPTERPNQRTRGVVNTASGLAAVFAAEPEPAAVQGVAVLGALSLGLRWEWALGPGETTALALRLERRAV
jgi:hypothetical protein